MHLIQLQYTETDWVSKYNNPETPTMMRKIHKYRTGVWNHVNFSDSKYEEQTQEEKRGTDEKKRGKRNKECIIETENEIKRGR